MSTRSIKDGSKYVVTVRIGVDMKIVSYSVDLDTDPRFELCGNIWKCCLNVILRMTRVNLVQDYWLIIMGNSVGTHSQNDYIQLCVKC